MYFFYTIEEIKQFSIFSHIDFTGLTGVQEIYLTVLVNAYYLMLLAFVIMIIYKVVMRIYDAIF